MRSDLDCQEQAGTLSVPAQQIYQERRKPFKVEMSESYCTVFSQLFDSYWLWLGL